jgi:hypothetical protein
MFSLCLEFRYKQFLPSTKLTSVLTLLCTVLILVQGEKNTLTKSIHEILNTVNDGNYSRNLCSQSDWKLSEQNFRLYWWLLTHDLTHLERVWGRRLLVEVSQITGKLQIHRELSQLKSVTRHETRQQNFHCSATMIACSSVCLCKLSNFCGALVANCLMGVWVLPWLEMSN